MKPSSHRSVGKGDIEAEFGEFSGKVGGEAVRSLRSRFEGDRVHVMSSVIPDGPINLMKYAVKIFWQKVGLIPVGENGTRRP
jgi:hypothetical protein